jgi:RNA polymerase sigma-70 factor (ECF subfamily)
VRENARRTLHHPRRIETIELEGETDVTRPTHAQTSSPSPADALSDPSVWVERHGDSLFRFALLRSGDRTEAEDLVQEALVAALGARERFAALASERTWLIGILKRKIVDRVRRARRASGGVHPAGDAGGSDDFSPHGKWKVRVSAWHTDPGQLAESVEFRAVLGQCLSKLPDRSRSAFLLREMDDLPPEEVCKALDLTPTNLWTLVHRARLRLRHCLEEHWFRTGR